MSMRSFSPSHMLLQNMCSVRVCCSFVVVDFLLLMFYCWRVIVDVLMLIMRTKTTIMPAQYIKDRKSVLNKISMMFMSVSVFINFDHLLLTIFYWHVFIDTIIFTVRTITVKMPPSETNGTDLVLNKISIKVDNERNNSKITCFVVLH